MNSTTAPVPNHLVWAIINTTASLIACCLTFCFPAIGTGIAAIVLATKVNAHLAAGDLEAAEKASKTAKVLNWITTALLLVSFIAWGIWVMINGMVMLTDML